MFKRIERLGIGWIDGVELFIKAHRLDDIPQLGGGHASSPAQDLDPLAVVTDQLRPTLIRRQQLFPLVATGEDPLQRRLGRIVFGVRLQRFEVARQRLVNLLQVLKLDLPPSQMEVRWPVRARLLGFDEPQRRLVNLQRLGPLLASIARTLVGGKRGPVGGIERKCLAIQSVRVVGFPQLVEQFPELKQVARALRRLLHQLEQIV